jgi:DNA-binding CsgD family transcriptional regulator/tetratricopeptide (TPR) repeat protein
MAPNMGAEFQALLTSDAPRVNIFATFLEELRHRPSIAVFEDVHWADEATLDLLRFIGRRVAMTSALLVATFRDDELTPRHPLIMMLGELVSSRAVKRISLKPLSEIAVRTLIGVQGIDAAELHHQTGGNPFFVTEVLANPEGGVPLTVRDAVLARAARLSRSGYAVLEAAAVIGQRVEPWLLTAVTGAEAPAVEECIAVGVLLVQEDDLAFRHELARETILGAMFPSRRQVLHRLVLDALKSSPGKRADLALLAHHAEAAGDREAVLEFAPAAARRAATAGAHREAAVLYALTIRTAGDAPDGERGFWLEEYAAELHTLGELEDSTLIRRQAIEAFRHKGDRRREGLNLARLAVPLINIGQPEAARHASQEALRLLQELSPGPELALALRTQAHLLLLNRDCVEAVKWGKQAIELAELFNDLDTLARAYTTVGAALLITDYESGRRYLEKCLKLGPEIGWDFGVANVYANLGSISCEIFRLQEAENWLSEGLAYTGERDLDFLGKYLLAWKSLTFVYLGRWEAAKQLAVEALQGIGLTTIGRIPAFTALGRLRARGGKKDPATPLDEALGLAMQSQTFQRISLVRTARAEAAWLAGDPAGTLAEAREVYDLAVDKKHPWFAGELAYWLRRAGDEVKAPKWIAKPYSLQLAGDWEGAAVEWERLGCPYEQARALAEGEGAARLAALEIFERLGARPDADRLREDLRSSGVPGIPHRSRESTRGNPFGLTDRQVEILRLLTEHLTNAEIAARLHISAKTVDHHVSAVLARLNVATRQEAADLASREPYFRNKK